MILRFSDDVAGSRRAWCQFRRCGGGGVYVAAADIQGLRSRHYLVMSATDSRHHCRVAHWDCMNLGAAMEPGSAAQKEVCTADCSKAAAFAALDSVSEDVRMNSVVVLLAAFVGTARNVLGVSGTDLGMVEAGSIVAAESADSAAVVNMCYQEWRMIAAVVVGRGMEKALVEVYMDAEDQYRSLLLPSYRKCFSNDERRRLRDEPFDICIVLHCAGTLTPCS